MLGDARRCADLLFVLGASQHLTTVLLRQAEAWEAAFLADCQGLGAPAWPGIWPRCAPGCPTSCPRRSFGTGCGSTATRAYLRIGTRDLLSLARLEETTRELSCLADAAVEVACELQPGAAG